jgi:hypothetical protein
MMSHQNGREYWRQGAEGIDSSFILGGLDGLDILLF